MIDIQKHVRYWQTGAREDWEAAQQLVAAGKARHGLFFAHLALEKLLKAHICLHAGELAPHTHNLVRLAERASLAMPLEQGNLLARMNAFNLEGRYPNDPTVSPTPAEGQRYLAEAEELYQWLTKKL